VTSIGDPDGGSTGDAVILRRDQLDPGTAYVAPRTEAEVAIAGLWQDILRIDKVGVDDNFFELGGDSLQVIALFVAIEERYGKVFPPSTIIEHATITELAKLLETNDPNSSASCLATLQSDGSGMPLFLFMRQVEICSHTVISSCILAPAAGFMDFSIRGRIRQQYRPCLLLKWHESMSRP
jgi:acyl carrier protein